jgi:uncharacterized protein
MEFIIRVRNQFEGTYTLRILEYFFELWWKILPYIVISIVLNIVAKRWIGPRRLLRPVSGELTSIIVAALTGLISPLPTYAAIPIALSLMPAGLRFGAVMAFILASPLMNPTIFFLTASQLGLEMAVARAVAAFLLAVAGGLLTSRIFTRLYEPQMDSLIPRTSSSTSLLEDILGNATYMLKYFSIALLISSALRALVPPELIMRLLGGEGNMGTLIAMAMGIPFYTCGGSAIPLMETLRELGMQKGPMLAFFIAGPATKLETLYAFKTQMGTKVLVFYLVLTCLFSFFAGSIYSFF